MRRLFLGAPPPPDRIFLHGIWFRGHNNPRQARLFPRFRRVDKYLITVSDRHPLRGLQFRALKATRGPRQRAIFAAANRRYGRMLTFDLAQVSRFAGRIVVDVDEPEFSEGEVQVLGRSNVAAVVVTTDGVARRYGEAGLGTPCHVIPQGVELSALRQADVQSVAAAHRGDGEIVVGYISAWLLSEGDRGHNHASDVDHLLELWDEVAARVPEARLWLIANFGRRAREACRARRSVKLLDDVPYGGALPYIANFDVALYPRRYEVPLPVKLLEYMGAGAPVASYDLELARIVRESGAGLLAATPRELVQAIERLARERSLRERLGAAGRRAAAPFDWAALAQRYQEEVLNRYLA